MINFFASQTKILIAKIFFSDQIKGKYIWQHCGITVVLYFYYYKSWNIIQWLRNCSIVGFVHFTNISLDVSQITMTRAKTPISINMYICVSFYHPHHHQLSCKKKKKHAWKVLPVCMDMLTIVSFKQMFWDH